MRWKLRTFLLMLTLLFAGVDTAQAGGFFQRLWELEKRKNQCLLEFFFGRRHHHHYHCDCDCR